MPDQNIKIKTEEIYTKVEYEKISKGYRAKGMEDKWNLFLEGNCLYMHRSWTGNCIYIAELERLPNFTYRLCQLTINQAPEQYTKPIEKAIDLALNTIRKQLIIGSYDPKKARG